MNDDQAPVVKVELLAMPISDDPKIAHLPRRIGLGYGGTVPFTYTGRAAANFQVRAGGRNQDAPAMDMGAAMLPEIHIWQVWTNHLRRHLGVDAVGIKDFGDGYAALTFIAAKLLAYEPPEGQFIALSLDFVPEGPVQAREHFVQATDDHKAAHAELHSQLTRPEYGHKARENTCNQTPQDMLYIMEELGTFANYALPNRQGAGLLARHIEGFLNGARVAEGIARLKP